MRHVLRWVTGGLIACGASQAHAAWYEAKSTHFVIYADDKPEKLQAFAQRLERFDQAVRLLRGTEDPSLTDSNRLRIYVLDSEKAVWKLLGRSTASGMYRSTMAGSVAFVPRTAGSSYTYLDLDAEQIFFHEYAHHLQLQYNAVAMPPWLREGFAEFFATAVFGKDGSVTIGKYPGYRLQGLYNSYGLTVPQIVSGSYGPLSIFSLNALYGWGWLLVHYLSFDDSRRGQLDKYVQGIQAGLGEEDAAKAAFGDLGKLDHDAHRYMRGALKMIVLKPALFSDTPMTIRPLSAGETAIMPVSIESNRGVDQKSAPEVAAHAREVAGPYPGDPFVQAALAEAEYDAAEYAAADAAADRALAADPNNVHALIYKGRAQTALAKQRGSADWTKIRQYYLRANKIDPENPEPLALYYFSFLTADQKPSRNAVDALLYAVVLAPQDIVTRFAAVRELIQENKFEEAKSMFAPLAYQPHVQPEAREGLAKIMRAISDGDSERALGLLGGSDKPNAGVSQPR
jgi:tetratricopeptide (TPR) repeat protein